MSATRSKSTTRKNWSNNSSNREETKSSDILFDSTPLYLPKKNSGIKSIEICFDKTNDRRKQNKKKSQSEKSLKNLQASSSEEDMLDNQKRTDDHCEDQNDENNLENVQIQAGIMINAQESKRGTFI